MVPHPRPRSRAARGNRLRTAPRAEIVQGRVDRPAAGAAARDGKERMSTEPESEVPEFYVDQFVMTVGAYGVAVTFGLTPPHPAPGEVPRARDLVRLRMSLEHVKVMAMLLKRQLKAFEEQAATTINIPRAVSNGLGLSPEDW
jgi:hypothetical protein